MRITLVLIALFSCLSGVASAQKAEIEKANVQWVQLFNKGDFNGLGMLYTEDARAFPPDAGIIKGRAAIADMWKGLAEQVTDPQVSTLEVKRLGPTAAQEIGTFKLKTKAQEPEEISGKYVAIWERVKGSWKISTDIWNSGE